MDYAELHCHSAFSLLDGASNPEELVERAKNIGLTALALTDHDDLGGAIRFAQAAKELEFDGIIGAELTLNGDEHIITLAKTLEGYKNICRLITHARMNCKRGLPRISMERLAQHSQGIIVLSGCPHGRIPKLIAQGKIEAAFNTCKLFLEIFKDDFYLELWDHDIAQEAIICKHLYEFATSLKIPWVVTNNPHYAYPEKRIIHDVLTCLRHEVTLSTAGRRLRPNGSWYLKSPKEMFAQWQHHPEGLYNTLVVAERCEFRLGLLKPELPQIDLSRAQEFLESHSFFRRTGVPSTRGPHPVLEQASSPVSTKADPSKADPPGVVVDPDNAKADPTNSNPLCSQSEHAFSSLRSQQMYELLENLTWLGAIERYNKNFAEKQINQLKHELDLIRRLELAPYFLIMWDIICFANSQGIAVQGRGSAANSAVCYCLKITAVDPIAMDLLFERFISEDRNEPPDIDLDIAHQEREKVLQYVYEKYGREHAAMVCEHITYRGASAVRDAARIFDFSPEQADKLSTQAQHMEAKSAAEALATGGAVRAGLDPRDRRVQLLIQVVAGLHQLPRHRGIHVGGFVLAGESIGSVVPVEPASMPGRTVIQWDKDDLDYAGLIKIDLLGLGMLMMIQESVKLIKKHRDYDLDLSQLDMTDQNIYQMMQRADTIGVFQVESRAQMSILPKIRPKCFYDIVVSIAIVRPGPIQGNIVHPYLKRRRGIEPVTYLHHTIEPILRRTFGVPLFQEQGMKLAVVAAGFTPSQADQLRRVMSHKRSLELMMAICVDLAAGMRKNGLSEEAIETITFQLRAFANYGFPESHAASFALLVFASAFIKYYYAPEFYCAILNAQPMGFYSPATLIRDAIRHGVEVRPIDLAHSYWDCTLEEPTDNFSGSDDLYDVNVDESGNITFAKRSNQSSAGASGASRSRRRGARSSMANASEQFLDVESIKPSREFGSLGSAKASGEFDSLSSAKENGNDIVGAPLSGDSENTDYLDDLEALLSPSGENEFSDPNSNHYPAMPMIQNGKRPPALRIGLRYVSGLGPGAKQLLERAWAFGGRFTSIEDVCQRSGLRVKDLERLAMAGAFDSFCDGRRQALWRVLKQARTRREMPLLKLLQERDAEVAKAKNSQNDVLEKEPFLPPMTDLETTIADYNIMGLSTGHHPMVFFRKWANAQRYFTCAGLSSRKNGEHLTVAGSVICRQRPHTAKGFVFITLEDETGTSNVIIRPQVFDEFKDVILTQNFIAVSGRLQLEEGVVNLLCSSVAALPRLAATDEIPIESRDFH